MDVDRLQRQRLLEALVVDRDRLYFNSATFHAQIEVMAQMIPIIIDALAVAAVEEDPWTRRPHQGGGLLHLPIRKVNRKSGLVQVDRNRFNRYGSTTAQDRPTRRRLNTMALELSTFAEKTFLSDLTESAASSTASVRTGTDDGVLLLDSVLTLTNSAGVGTTFAFAHAFDPEFCPEHQPCFNDYETLSELRDDVLALLNAVNEWGGATLGAIDDVEKASLLG